MGAEADSLQEVMPLKEFFFLLSMWSLLLNKMLQCSVCHICVEMSICFKVFKAQSQWKVKQRCLTSLYYYYDHAPSLLHLSVDCAHYLPLSHTLFPFIGLKTTLYLFIINNFGTLYKAGLNYNGYCILKFTALKKYQKLQCPSTALALHFYDTLVIQTVTPQIWSISRGRAKARSVSYQDLRSREGSVVWSHRARAETHSLQDQTLS